MEHANIRAIKPEDNPALERIIRGVLREKKVPEEGSALADPSLHDLYSYYQQPGAAYLVVEIQGRLLGGGGVAPLPEAEAGICELQKMYLLPESRGRGIGKRLLRSCLDMASELGYKTCYLETMPNMEAAQHLYRLEGFEYLEGPLGNTGHCACQTWMLAPLSRQGRDKATVF